MPKISNSIYIDETEVNILDWITYLSDISKENPKIDIRKYLPDTSKIRSDCRFLFRPFFSTYAVVRFKLVTTERAQLWYFPQVMYTGFYDEKFYCGKCKRSDTPITGITYEQAVAYCEWRTRKLNQLLSEEKEQFSSKLRKSVVKVRLISPEEFEKYSMLKGFREKRSIKKTDYKNVVLDSLNDFQEITFAYKIDDFFNPSYDCYGYGPMPLALFYSDFLTVYDWFGNVAEMTSEKGIAKGGSYHHYASEANPKNNINYLKPELWLGFRTIIEIEK